MFNRKTCFLGPKMWQLSQTPGELPKNAWNFPNRPGPFQNTRGTSQKQPELFKYTRKFPETPGELLETPGELLKHLGTWENVPELPKDP
jgi:hypothetical protein